MKLVALLIASVLAVPAVATADVLQPPGGPVYSSDRADPPRPPAQRGQRGQRGQRLKRAVLAQFDANGDGRLGPRERMRAIRTLRRIERRLAQRGQQQQGRQDQRNGRRRIIERFDTNRDGNVGPGELPPRAARRLRRFDRDHDGWIEPGELP